MRNEVRNNEVRKDKEGPEERDNGEKREESSIYRTPGKQEENPKFRQAKRRSFPDYAATSMATA
jgi:hypothetical protein